MNFTRFFSVHPKNKRQKKDFVCYDKTVVEKNLKLKIFTVKDNEKGTADFWKTYQQIADANKQLVNHVVCRFCNRVDEYDTYKGTKTLRGHSLQCNALKRTNTLDTYFDKQINVTKEEKADLCSAVAQLCYKDLRPFIAIENDGQLALLLAISKLSSKYGEFSLESLKKKLPCPKTVII